MIFYDTIHYIHSKRERDAHDYHGFHVKTYITGGGGSAERRRVLVATSLPRIFLIFPNLTILWYYDYGYTLPLAWLTAYWFVAGSPSVMPRAFCYPETPAPQLSTPPTSSVLPSSISMPYSKGTMEITQETTKARLAELLKRVRKTQHMTQVQVAERFQVSQPAVAQWETGATTPPAHVVIWLVEMSAALGIGTPQ